MSTSMELPAEPTGVIGKLTDRLQLQTVTNQFSRMKPLSEFFDVKRMSLTTDTDELKSRVRANLAYFSGNYVVLALMLAVYDLFTNVLLLIDLLFVAGSFMLLKKLDGQDWNLGFTSLSTARLRLYTGLIGVPLFIIASPLTTLIWLVGANGVAILGHAAAREKPEDLLLPLYEDSQEVDDEKT